MSVADIFIFTGYFIVSLLLGIIFHDKGKNQREYYLAGKSLRWFPIGISIMITAFSAINITAFSGEVFANGFYTLMSIPIFFLVAVPVKRIVIPFFYNQNITSAYEYFEVRYNTEVRRLAAVMFIFWRILWIATVIYIPSRILSIMTGLSVTFIIVLIGGVATLYTFWGGIKAVIWTDVLQFFVMIGGLTAAIIFTITQITGGIHGIIDNAATFNLFKPFSPFDPTIFCLNPHIRISFWSAIIGTFIAFLTRYSADQMIVQRYLSAKNLTEAKKGFTLNYLIAMLSILLLAFLGLTIYSYFINSGEYPKTEILPIHYFTRFIQQLPAGISGLMITAIIAASMSSFDSGIHSCSTVIKIDFDNNFIKKLPPQSIVIILGFIITLISIYIRNFGSIFEIANRIVNGFGSPLLALFVMGKYSRKSTGTGAFWGGITGLVFSSLTILFIKNIALHYYAAINFAATLLFIYCFSLIRNQQKPALSK